MIRYLAKALRGLHGVMGITAPEPGKNEGSFVLMWFGIILFILGFCWLLLYMMAYVF